MVSMWYHLSLINSILSIRISKSVIKVTDKIIKLYVRKVNLNHSVAIYDRIAAKIRQAESEWNIALN